MRCASSSKLLNFKTSQFPNHCLAGTPNSEVRISHFHYAQEPAASGLYRRYRCWTMQGQDGGTVKASANFRAHCKSADSGRLEHILLLMTPGMHGML